jgi:hypothetical protein
MPWVVGIDEAGYGPNLGPLVQAAVALRLPEHDVGGWETLKPAVRRCREKADGRLLIDDSKKVYTRGGLAALERGLWPVIAQDPHRIDDFLWSQEDVPSWGEDLCEECWFDGGDAIPVAVDPNGEWAAGDAFRAAIGERWRGDVRIVPAPRFNRLVDESGSKAVVLYRGLVELMSSLTAVVPAGESVTFLCDKLGGRNYYAAIVQEAAFPNGWIAPEREAADESRYRVEFLDRPVTVVFRPRADGDSVAVALASMLCKYLREVCMLQFNRFWARHVPGIEPTAGYPVDAKRFFAQIKPAMAKLGLTDDQVWRKR